MHLHLITPINCPNCYQVTALVLRKKPVTLWPSGYDQFPPPPSPHGCRCITRTYMYLQEVNVCFVLCQSIQAHQQIVVPGPDPGAGHSRHLPISPLKYTTLEIIAIAGAERQTQWGNLQHSSKPTSILGWEGEPLQLHSPPLPHTYFLRSD